MNYLRGERFKYHHVGGGKNLVKSYKSYKHRSLCSTLRPRVHSGYGVARPPLITTIRHLKPLLEGYPPNVVPNGRSGTYPPNPREVVLLFC